jgi:RimJ/RimL family protein N-acetyltransferase
LLEGKTVNLRIVEREDLLLLTEWQNTPEISGEFMFREQKSRAEAEKEYENRPPDSKTFFIEKKDGTRIGWIGHFMNYRLLEIYYYLLPSERRKGYGTEAITIMVDYLFLSRDLTRIQATCDLLIPYLEAIRVGRRHPLDLTKQRRRRSEKKAGKRR